MLAAGEIASSPLDRDPLPLPCPPESTPAASDAVQASTTSPAPLLAETGTLCTAVEGGAMVAKTAASCADRSAGSSHPFLRDERIGGGIPVANASKVIRIKKPKRRKPALTTKVITQEAHALLAKDESRVCIPSGISSSPSTRGLGILQTAGAGLDTPLPPCSLAKGLSPRVPSGIGLQPHRTGGLHAVTCAMGNPSLDSTICHSEPCGANFQHVPTLGENSSQGGSVWARLSKFYASKGEATPPVVSGGSEPVVGQRPRSFVQVVKASGLPSHGVTTPHVTRPAIAEKMVETHRGEACITFDDLEVEQMNKIEDTLLVGKFSHGRPTLHVIRAIFAKSFKLRGTVEIGLVDPRHVFLAFSNPEDCVSILVKGQILFDGKCPMRLFRWTMDFDTRFETPLAPVWVLLPNLKANCFSEPCLRQIVKPVGKFLQVDAATTRFSRPNVARVKVEIDLLKPRRDKLFIRLGTLKPGREDYGFWQTVEYERVPPYCVACRKQGHLAAACRANGRVQHPQPAVDTTFSLAGTGGPSHSPPAASKGVGQDGQKGGPYGDTERLAGGDASLHQRTATHKRHKWRKRQNNKPELKGKGPATLGSQTGTVIDFQGQARNASGAGRSVTAPASNGCGVDLGAICLRSRRNSLVPRRR